MFLGFSTVLSIFGLKLSVLLACADDKVKNAAPGEQIVNELFGVIVAITSGSFLKGAACSVLVVIGGKRAQRK